MAVGGVQTHLVIRLKLKPRLIKVFILKLCYFQLSIDQ